MNIAKCLNSYYESNFTESLLDAYRLHANQYWDAEYVVSRCLICSQGSGNSAIGYKKLLKSRNHHYRALFDVCAMYPIFSDEGYAEDTDEVEFLQNLDTHYELLLELYDKSIETANEKAEARDVLACDFLVYYHLEGCHFTHKPTNYQQAEYWCEIAIKNGLYTCAKSMSYYCQLSGLFDAADNWNQEYKRLSSTISN